MVTYTRAIPRMRLLVVDHLKSACTTKSCICHELQVPAGLIDATIQAIMGGVPAKAKVILEGIGMTEQVIH